MGYKIPHFFFCFQNICILIAQFAAANTCITPAIANDAQLQARTTFQIPLAAW